MEPPSKRCPVCTETKLLTSEFWHRNKGRGDGVESICKLCKRKANNRRYAEVRDGLDFEITVEDPVVEAAFSDRTAIDPVVSSRLAERKATRYLITSAQNATPVHTRFWETLQVAAKHLDAQILVVPLRYKNPTSQWTANNRDHDWWDSTLQGYLIEDRKQLHQHLVLAADVKTQPTASAPLSGFESLTGAESCVLGHTKMQFRTVPVPSGRFPKILTTTGACTLPNFTNTKTGKIGEFHHYLGALIVEDDGDLFHIRQLNADTTEGSFYDLGKFYDSVSVSAAMPALALQMGDTHARFADPDVDHATFGKGGMVEVLNPQTLVWNDTFDGYSVNPHHIGNPFITQGKFKGRIGNVREEVIHAVEFVRRRTAGRKSVVVPSNHDDFLARWMNRADWKTDPVNARFYLQTALAMLDSVEPYGGGTRYADPFTYWVGQLTKPEDNIRCLARGESLVIGGTECGLHGDRGPNGAKGTLKNLSRLGTKVNSGHRHGPGIEEGHYGAGTSTPLELEYTVGSPSSWLHTHIATYANGARALLTIIDGRWRRSEPE